MALLAPVIKQRFFDVNGAPLSGGKLYSYAAGTATPLATYKAQDGLEANTNPIILNSSGECDLWITSGSFKFVLKDSSDAILWTIDNVQSFPDAVISGLSTLTIGKVKIDGTSLRFYDNDLSNFVALKAAADVAGDLTFTLPVTDGSAGQALVTSGSAALGWASVFANPMTTGGDIIYGGASGTATRLANGTANQYLKSQGTTLAPVWATFTTPTIQKFTSGSGTYTTPAGVKYIRVRLVGAGGGGAGSGTGSMGGGGTGGATTFGTTLLSGGGGLGGSAGASGNPGAGGAGGAASLGTGPIGTAVTGGTAGRASNNGTEGTAILTGGFGGSAPFFSGSGGNSGGAGITNTGGGGAGAGGNNIANFYTGGGGGSGGFVDALIVMPSGTYSYAVGAAGSAGGAGTSGGAGGAGGSGVIIVEEFYF